MMDAKKMGGMAFQASAQTEEACRRIGETNGLGADAIRRLAVGASLADSNASSLKIEGVDDAVAQKKGRDIFGGEAECAAWLACFVADGADSPDALRKAVRMHWERGARKMGEAWDAAQKNSDDTGAALQDFLRRVTDMGDLSGKGRPAPVRTGAVRVDIGVDTAEAGQGTVAFHVNKAGSSPHMALMGRSGGGKTQLAMGIAQEIVEQSGAPILAFDFKGDLAEKWAGRLNAKVVDLMEESLPLSVLTMPDAKGESGAIGAYHAAGRIAESLARVKAGGTGEIQKNDIHRALENAFEHAEDASRGISMQDLQQAWGRVRDSATQDGTGALLDSLTRASVFDGSQTPEQFFSQSWIIRVPASSSEDIRRFVVNMTLDALDGWLNSQDEAEVDDHQNAKLRHVLALEEAHLALRTKLPALGSLLRQSRSKGGVTILISQGPDDFVASKEDYLQHMGLVASYATSAKTAAVATIFDDRADLNRLPTGILMCKMGSDAAQRIRVWGEG